ncbi:hypothetical protein HMPREF1531_01179 [Propionibacterium sp. oral taxon 192 str. F0372]|uniref:dihydrodipicolinate synthase family protein n=1 Tax=Propionibacterium sp. oral taxon 192 TaxID=671222 RepID=UPI000353DCBC|nr:dihydrodipicolinate synthase family protein [Propionibacterium sp. oral taxon 192]EPH03754.1 hypothetical protein HMPREF1531_01179 [Propionibacterium sp. oral taxon 192 str. F0372]
MNILNGIVPPVITPMNPDGSVDFASLDRLVEHLITGGVDGLFPMGSSGQVAYLSDEDREKVVAAVIAKTAGRVPVLVGCPDMSATRAIAQARRAEELGATAVVISAPVYALNSPDEIADHFRMVAAAVGVPVIAYDVPVRVGRKLTVDTLVTLGTEGVIMGVKDSSGDDVAFRRLLAANRAAGSPLVVSTGHEIMCDAMALIGADGIVPGLANVDVTGYVRLWKAAQSGDWEACRAEQERIARLFEIAFVPQGRSGDAGGIGAFKAAAAMLGIIDHPAMPAPLKTLTEADNQAIEAILREVGLLK